MKFACAAAARLALCAAALLGGCASLTGTPGQPTSGEITPETSAAAAASGMHIEIDAPPELKALLERHLDIVRLGRLTRDVIDDTEWTRLIDATPAQVRELLQTEGYFNPQVRLERNLEAESGQPPSVHLLLQPGERARVSRMNLEAEGELERGAAAGDPYALAVLEQLRRLWPLRVGQAFRNPAWNEAKSATLARLRAAGYASASWLGTGAEVDTEGHTVRLYAVVDSGPMFRFASLQVEGLVVQDEQTVNNLLRAQPGTPVTETMLLDFQERLQKSNLFESINVTLDPDPAQATQARVVARLRESALQIYTLGVGVSTNTGPRASVEHLYRRVFGFAASSRLKLELGKKRQAGDAEISTHALEGLYRNLVGGAVERLISDTDVVLSQRMRVGRSQDSQRIERLYFAEVERSLRTTDAGAASDASAVSLNFHGGWRDLDSIILPTDGLVLALQVGGGRSRGTDAESGYFGRLYGRLMGYFPLPGAWYSQARIELGQVLLRPRMVVPESQRWRAGGDESVRGYGYRSLGPITDGVVGSGNAIFTVSAEVARPIVSSMPNLWGAVFVDAGNAADKLADLKPALGAGVGLRWRSPVGPFRIDWAYGREVHKSRLHFSVGIAF